MTKPLSVTKPFLAEPPTLSQPTQITNLAFSSKCSKVSVSSLVTTTFLENSICRAFHQPHEESHKLKFPSILTQTASSVSQPKTRTTRATPNPSELNNRRVGFLQKRSTGSSKKPKSSKRKMLQNEKGLMLRINWKAFCINLSNSLERVPSIKEYCQTQLDWLEENQDASTEDLQAKMKEVQDFIQAEVAKNGGAPGAPGGAPNANDMPANIDEID